MRVTNLLSSAVKCLQLQGASLCPWTPLGAPLPVPNITSRSRARHILSVPVLFLTGNEPCLWPITHKYDAIHKTGSTSSEEYSIEPSNVYTKMWCRSDGHRKTQRNTQTRSSQYSTCVPSGLSNNAFVSEPRCKSSILRNCHLSQ